MSPAPERALTAEDSPASPDFPESDAHGVASLGGHLGLDDFERLAESGDLGRERERLANAREAGRAGELKAKGERNVPRTSGGDRWETMRRIWIGRGGMAKSGNGGGTSRTKDDQLPWHELACTKREGRKGGSRS